MALSVAIIGRPNVGKSTLFNRLVGRKLALVDDEPGVTRDRREGDGELAGLTLHLIDTAGLEEAAEGSLEARMRAQTERAVDDADVALLLIDSRAGITPLDEHFADWIRAKDTPVVLAANKCEGRAGEAGYYEAFSLGLGEPVPVSAEHGDGMAELYAALAPFDEAPEPPAEEDSDDDAERSGPLQLAIVGRPNVGKSTLVNRLIGDDRLLTGPEAGITRDAISVDWEYDGQAIRLIDTAGLRRRAKVTEKLENLSSRDSFRAIQFAEVVVLVLDGVSLLEKQDLTIARQVIDEGRALVIAVNKWDLVKEKRKALKDLQWRINNSIPQAKGIRAVTLSAKTGKGLEHLLPALLDTYRSWNRRVPTGPLNRWLEDVLERHPPPVTGGRRLRIRYMTQAKTRPPTFVVFASRAKGITDAYRRYLVNGLRDQFDIPGVPIRLMVRQGKNPYVDDDR